MRTKIIQIWIF